MCSSDLLIVQNVFNNRGHNIVLLLDKLFSGNISFKKQEKTEDLPAIGDINISEDAINISVSSKDIITWENWKTKRTENQVKIDFEYQPEFFDVENKRVLPAVLKVK